jgi:hypothetical protein
MSRMRKVKWSMVNGAWSMIKWSEFTIDHLTLAIPLLLMHLSASKILPPPAIFS